MSQTKVILLPRLVSIRTLMLPALVVYGFIMDPLTGHGGLPCLWRLCFGIGCPGCGLSIADGLLVRGAVLKAFSTNWLILPVWMAAVHSFTLQIYNFLAKGKTIYG